MCRYCEFEYKEEPFTDKLVYRGDLFLNEKDSDIYIERTGVEFEFTEYYDYYMITQLANRKKIEQEVNFCPFCGLELPKIQ